MNLPEKIAGAYLRLNGFFLMPQFTVFDDQYYSHVDFLGFRPDNSREQIEVYNGFVDLPLDENFFRVVSKKIDEDYGDVSLGVIAEVKGNKTIETPSQEHIEYATRMLGKSSQIISVSFTDSIDTIGEGDDNSIIIGIKYALDWIFKRFQWMDENIPRHTKTGSWFLSEDGLSDLIYLYKINDEDD